MLDHGKPEFAKESEPLRILVVVVKRWRHLGNRLWACRTAVISLLHFRPNRLFSTLYTASQQLLRKECESGRVNNWEGLQINKRRSRYEIIQVKKLPLLKSIPSHGQQLLGLISMAKPARSQRPSDAWFSTLKIGEAQPCSVTEIAPKPSFLCVNRIP